MSKTGKRGINYPKIILVSAKTVLSKIWSFFSKTGAFVFVLIVLFAAVVALFPEVGHSVSKYFYRKVNLNEPAFTIQNLFLDGMSPLHEFSYINLKEYAGCPEGYYATLYSGIDPGEEHRKAPYQQFINLSPSHSVAFWVQRNPFINGAVVIRNVYLDIVEKTANSEQGFKTICDGGAGGTAKMFYVDDESLKQAEIGSTIEAAIDSNNTIPFDLIILDEDNPVDVIVVKIPADINEIIGFRVRLKYQTSQGVEEKTTGNLYIGNSKLGNDYFFEGVRGKQLEFVLPWNYD